MAFEVTEQIERHLEGDHIAWLTTVTPSGRPAPRPVWFVWDGAVITIYTQPTGAKIRHIEVNPKVTVHFSGTPSGGDVVVIAGTAVLLRGAPPPSEVPGMLGKYLPTIQQMGYDQEWYDSYNLAIHVTPERAWAIPG